MRIKIFGLAAIFLLVFLLVRIINGIFQLDDLKSTKLAQLLLAKNLTLQFDIRQQNSSQIDLFCVDYGNEILFRLATSTLKMPNMIFLEFGLRDGRHKLFKVPSPFFLGNNQFHTILLILNGRSVTVVQNCHQLFYTDDDELEFGHQSLNGLDLLNITLGAGLHHTNDSALQMRSFSLNVALPPNSLCPQFDRIEYKTPTIFDNTVRLDDKQQNIGDRIERLEQKVNYWEKLLRRLGGRLRSVELHQRGCKVGTEWYKAGQRVQELAQCRECHCSSDSEVHCAPIGCPQLECSHPLTVQGKCCPECGKTCFYNGRIYESGDSFWPKQCVHCVCNNGRMNCEFRNVAHCPTLSCEQRETLPNQCCPVCVNIDHCINQQFCDPNAFCTSTRHSAVCRCNPGFFGNGTKCYDVNECLWDENARAQLGGCGVGAFCINVPGSFKCDCMPGFQKMDELNCLDLVRI